MQGCSVGSCEVYIQTQNYAASECLDLQLVRGVKALAVLCKVSAVTGDRSKL